MCRSALLFVSSAVILGGCEAHNPLMGDRVYPGAGDAIAANSVMQMVDPWQRGVQDPDLTVPADMDQYRPQAEGTAPVTNGATTQQFE